MAAGDDSAARTAPHAGTGLHGDEQPLTLAIRLHGLLADNTDPEIKPLRALLARLTSAALDTDAVEDLWLATRKALEDFLAHTTADTSRATFWKR